MNPHDPLLASGKASRWYAAAVMLAMQACPAAATSCETDRIAARSVEETAKLVYEASDHLGFGFVHEVVVVAPQTHQQEVDLVVSLKGGAATVRLAPRTVDGVSMHDGNGRWFFFKPEELHLFALVATAEGAVSPTCLAANIASKPVPALYKALVVEARRHGTASAE